jgi:hypothetical protein
LASPAAALRRRASASSGPDTSIPSTCPSGAARAAARVETPAPQPTSSTRSAAPIPAAPSSAGSNAAEAASKRSARAAQSSPSAPFQAPAISALRASTSGGCGGTGTVIAFSPRRGLDLGWSRTAAGLPTPADAG